VGSWFWGRGGEERGGVEMKYVMFGGWLVEGSGAYSYSRIALNGDTTYGVLGKPKRTK